MSAENTMVVFGVESKDAAHELLKSLQQIDVADDNVEIKHVAFAEKLSPGHIHLEEYDDLKGGRGAFGGGAIGLLAGTIVAGPVGAAVGSVVGAAVAGLYAKLRDSGFSDNFMKEVTEKLEDGQTALFMVYDGTLSDAMLDALKAQNATLAYGVLPEDIEQTLSQTYEETGEELVSNLEVFTAEATEVDAEPTEEAVAPIISQVEAVQTISTDDTTSATPDTPAAAPADNLTVIDGIGPKIQMALAAGGITTYEQLYRASEPDLRESLLRAGLRMPPSAATWSRQAHLAMQGDWKGLYKFNATNKVKSGKSS